MHTQLGTSPLHLAAQHGHYSTAEVLLRAGVSRDARTKVDRTPLHVAAADGHARIVELLLKNGADVNAKDMLQMTALHWATEHGHGDVVELLLRHGADVHASSKFEKSAFDIALDKNNPETLGMLQEAMQNQVSIHPETTTPISSAVTLTSPVLLTPGEVLDLTGLLSSARAKTTSGKAEEPGGGNPAHSAIQQVVGSGGQPVIAILSDSIALGSLHTALPSSQPFVLSVQDGQEVVTVPAGQAAQETALEHRDYAPEEHRPVAKRQKVEQSACDAGEDKDSVEREVLQHQLQEANRKAREYRSQLLRKEQEAEGCRLRLAAMGRQQAELGPGTQAEPPVGTSGSIEASVLSMLGTDPATATS